MIISAASMICCVAYGQKNMITFEIESLIRSGEIELRLSHGIGRKWTAAFSTAFVPDIEWKDEEKIEHKESFMKEDIEERQKSKEGRFHSGIYAQFWPKGIYEGPYISYGIGSDCSKDINLLLSAGYMFTILKSLKGSIGYRMDLLELLKYDDRSGCHITVGLSLSF